MSKEAPESAPKDVAVATAPAGARPPVGAGEAFFEGIARHSVVLGGYLKGLFTIALGVVFGILLQKIERLAGYPLWLLGLVGVPMLLVTYLRHVTTRFKITGKRIETEHGLVSRRVDSLELWRVLDVRYEQSLGDRIFGNAKIILIGNDRTDPVLVLHGLPDHRVLFEKLREAVQSARMLSRPMEVVGGHDATSGEVAAIAADEGRHHH